MHTLSLFRHLKSPSGALRYDTVLDASRAKFLVAVRVLLIDAVAILY